MRASVTSLSAGAALLLLSAVDRRPADARRSTPPKSTASSIPSRPPTSKSTIEKADAAGAALVVITLRTPGGLVDSTRDINNAIIRAKTPVAVFVGPSGNRAASAGFLITIAADIAAMAPGHAHRRGASRRRQRREGRRDDGEEDDVGRRRLRADAGGAAEAQRRARRAGGHGEPLVHRTGSDQRDPAAHRSRSPTTCRTSLRKLDGRTIARFDGRSQTLHTGRRIDDRRRDDLAAAGAERDRAPADRVPAADARHARADDRVVEPRRDPAGRRRRHLPAAGVLRVPGAAGQLRRRPADPLRPRAAHPRGEGHELRPARRSGGSCRCSSAR